MNNKSGQSPASPDPGEFESNLTQRHRKARFWRIIYQVSTVIGIVVLVVLLLQSGAAYYLIDRFLFQPDEDLLMAIGEGERPRVIPESNVPEASVGLGEFVVNPRSEGIRMLATIDVTLVVAPDDAASEITALGQNEPCGRDVQRQAEQGHDQQNGRKYTELQGVTDVEHCQYDEQTQYQVDRH